VSQEEHSIVQFGHTRISYFVRRSARRVTVSIAIEPTGKILLTAPVAVSLQKLDQVVHTKAKWITSRLKIQRELPQRPREFVSGETFLYLGRQYRLKVATDKAPVVLRGGWLIASTPKEPTIERASAVRVALRSWYRAHATKRLKERVAFWAVRLGRSIPTVLIRDQKRRWGSCDPSGTLRLNWRIIQAPFRLLDYVVAHELVHLTHPNHTKAFWAMLGRIMPDYEARKEALRLLGGRLLW
jgi:predicted metal-dependent hydrolase